MAPSAASRPPFDRSGFEQSEERSQQGQAEQAPAQEAVELYGPLGLERYGKDDGRTLILYARREREDA